MSNVKLTMLALLFGLMLLAGCTQGPNPVAPAELSTQATTSRQTDFTDATPTPQTQTDYAMVVFKSAPAAAYAGGIPGLERTKPQKGARFDPDSPAAQAYVQHLENEHADYRSFLNRGAPLAEVVAEQFYVLNSITVKLNGGSLQELQRDPDVKAVVYSDLYRPAMNRSVEIIEADTFWQTTGLTGAGVKVGIIDSGIDDSHPFFACKAAIPHKAYASGVAFDPSNVLVNDHGTHVAGTVAGCADTAGPLGITLSGVAPDAELYDYNVFPGFGGGYVAFGGSAFSHDIAEAIEDALLDGMDVVNMSLGGSVQGPNDFLAEAADTAVEAGMVVVVAAGNEGPGAYTVGSPGSASQVITVGASSNSHVIGVPVRVDADGDGLEDQNHVGARGDFDPFAAQPALNTALVTATELGDTLACSALSGNAGGAVVLISRGACSFTTKIRNAENVGASGVVVYNNTGDGPVSMGHDGTAFPTIPAIGISRDAGQAILAALTAGTTVSIDGNNLEEFTVPADVLAGFSSRGPVPFTGIMKPDLTAPGVNVLSSVFGADYALFNGTSMATPHVTGAVALLLSAQPEWSPADVKSALMTSTDLPAPLIDLSYAERGTGRLNVFEAVNAGIMVSPPSVSFGFHNLGGHSKIREVQVDVRSEAGTVTCSLSATGSVTLSQSTLTLDPGASFSVALDNADRRVGDEEGDVTLSCGSDTLVIPWASYQKP